MVEVTVVMYPAVAVLHAEIVHFEYPAVCGFVGGFDSICKFFWDIGMSELSVEPVRHILGCAYNLSVTVSASVERSVIWTCVAECSAVSLCRGNIVAAVSHTDGEEYLLLHEVLKGHSADCLSDVGEYIISEITVFKSRTRFTYQFKVLCNADCLFKQRIIGTCRYFHHSAVGYSRTVFQKLPYLDIGVLTVEGNVPPRYVVRNAVLDR